MPQFQAQIQASPFNEAINTLTQDADFMAAPMDEQALYIQSELLPKYDPEFAKAPIEEQNAYIQSEILPAISGQLPQPLSMGYVEPDQPTNFFGDATNHFTNAITGYQQDDLLQNSGQGVGSFVGDMAGGLVNIGGGALLGAGLGSLAFNPITPIAGGVTGGIGAAGLSEAASLKQQKRLEGEEATLEQLAGAFGVGALTQAIPMAKGTKLLPKLTKNMVRQGLGSGAGDLALQAVEQQALAPDVNWQRTLAASAIGAGGGGAEVGMHKLNVKNRYNRMQEGNQTRQRVRNEQAARFNTEAAKNVQATIIPDYVQAGDTVLSDPKSVQQFRTEKAKARQNKIKTDAENYTLVYEQADDIDKPLFKKNLIKMAQSGADVDKQTARKALKNIADNQKKAKQAEVQRSSEAKQQKTQEVLKANEARQARVSMEAEEQATRQGELNKLKDDIINRSDTPRKQPDINQRAERLKDAIVKQDLDVNDRERIELDIRLEEAQNSNFDPSKVKRLTNIVNRLEEKTTQQRINKAVEELKGKKSTETPKITENSEGSNELRAELETLNRGEQKPEAKPDIEQPEGLIEFKATPQAISKSAMVDKLETAFYDKKVIQVKYDAEIAGERLTGKSESGYTVYGFGTNKAGEPFVRTVDGDGQFTTLKLNDGQGNSSLKDVSITENISKYEVFENVNDLKKNGDPKLAVRDKKTGEIVEQRYGDELRKTSELSKDREAISKIGSPLEGMTKLQIARIGEALRNSPVEKELKGRAKKSLDDLNTDSIGDMMSDAESQVSPQAIKRSLEQMPEAERKKIFKEIIGEDC